MGNDYSFEIYLPARQVARALEQTSRAAEDGDPVQIVLPGGERLVLSFSRWPGTGVFDCSRGQALDLRTSLLFEVDDAVRDYVRDDDCCEFDEHGRTAIGYIYLTVEFATWMRPDYAELSFLAATDDMSRLFERSRSVQRFFTELAAASGAACCLLNREYASREVYWLNGRALAPPWHIAQLPEWEAVYSGWPQL